VALTADGSLPESFTAFLCADPLTIADSVQADTAILIGGDLEVQTTSVLNLTPTTEQAALPGDPLIVVSGCVDLQGGTLNLIDPSTLVDNEMPVTVSCDKCLNGQFDNITTTSSNPCKTITDVTPTYSHDILIVSMQVEDTSNSPQCLGLVPTNPVSSFDNGFSSNALAGTIIGAVFGVTAIIVIVGFAVIRRRKRLQSEKVEKRIRSNSLSVLGGSRDSITATNSRRDSISSVTAPTDF